MKTTLKNQIYLYIFCGVIGFTAGAVIWCFLKVVSEGTKFLWEWLPARADLPYYTVLLCTAGGLLIGLFRKAAGDYPEDLETVFAKYKQNRTYEYNKMPVLLVAAMLPLLMGCSIGPEAGLTGVIVGLCCWAGDNLKFAKNNARAYSQVGMAVSLSVLFRAPLFGVFAVEEENENAQIGELTRTSKLIVYGLAVAAGTGCYLLLTGLFGVAMEGFPSFASAEPEGSDFAMLVVYILIGCVMAAFYELTHRGLHMAARKIPAVASETIAGFCLGAVGLAVPLIMFSGEEQMGELMTDYGNYLPLALIGIAFLKILMTNLCIQMGLKGGHFFPVIFAGVCMGYGLAMLVFPESGDHVVFAAAMVTAALLGGTMKKPLAVTMLLLICFPVRFAVWIFLAAAVSAKVMKAVQKKKSA